MSYLKRCEEQVAKNLLSLTPVRASRDEAQHSCDTIRPREGHLDVFGWIVVSVLKVSAPHVLAKRTVQPRRVDGERKIGAKFHRRSGCGWLGASLPVAECLSPHGRRILRTERLRLRDLRSSMHDSV
jgi:hypothetical protein